MDLKLIGGIEDDYEFYGVWVCWIFVDFFIK